MVRVKEEEIIKEVKTMFKDSDSKYWIGENGVKAIQGLLDLYEKAKEDVVKQYELGLTQGAYEKNLVWEDKIRERISWLVRGPYADKYQQGKIDGLQELLNKEDQGNE